MGTTMEARNLSSLSSHSLLIQSLIARQNAAERSSEKMAGEPCRTLQIAYRVWNASRAWVWSVVRSLPGKPFDGRQSGRALIGALGGKALAL